MKPATSPPAFHVFPERASLIEGTADHIVELAARAVNDRGRFNFALSGGTTPRELYELLASRRYAPQIDWARVELFWSDERCVPPEHPASNYRMVQETLLGPLGLAASNVHRMAGELEPDRAAALYEELLHRHFKIADGDPPPRFDLILLGMGDDGHVASLFPGSPALLERRRWVVTSLARQPIVRRLTFTLPLINASTAVLFLVAGAQKAEPLARVAAKRGEVDPLPAQRVDPDVGALHWFVDAEAAARLEG